MRAGLLLSLAWADYRGEARLSLCAIFALAAVITPLLVLFGLKYGLVSTLTERLERAPSVREIIPVGGARYRAEDIAALAARADVAFAVPRTRQIAATADLSGGGETALSVEIDSQRRRRPAAGRPAATRPGRPGVVLSHGAAEKLGAQPGERIVARIGRRMDGQAQSQRLELEVLAVLPQERFARDALFAPLALLEAAEDYRDGRAVAAYGWPGKAGETPRARIYPGFRLYARDLDAVEGLRRHFVASGVEVATQAEAIAQVRSLSRNLGLVFWIVAALAIGGAFAAIAASSLAAVERKRRALAVLRLLGFPTAALVGFVMLLALFSAVFGLFLAGLLYAATAGALNHLFDNQSGEFVCRLLPSHYLTALLATLLCSVLAAASGGWRAARIEAAEGLRDV
ncbi:type IV secretion associated ABC transporter permease TagS [Pseudomonas aeruginosa]